MKFNLGSNVDVQLKKFAERRTDIFGTGAQETTIGRKVSWIFHFISFLPTTLNHSRLVKKIDVPTIKFNGMVTLLQVTHLFLSLSRVHFFNSISSSGENFEESNG